MDQEIKNDMQEQVANDIRDRIARKMKRRHSSPGALIGIVLIVIGGIVLLDHMGLIDSTLFWKFWPLLLIIWGLHLFFQECSRVFGAVLIVVGAVLQINKLGIGHLSWDALWPLILIGIGCALIWNRFEIPGRFKTGVGGSSIAAGPNSINEHAVFGGVERRVHTNSFTGGSVTALFGGVEIDFRSADIEGEEAVLQIEVIFGGIEVSVPDHWRVIWEGESVFGGYSDETRAPLSDLPGTRPTKRLIIRGRALFGGISIKN